MAVYDCFIFYNELALLELRLKTLYDVVDHFVLVESNKTHQNEPKPFIFAEHKADFVPYLDKIIYIQEEDVVPYSGKGDWGLEYHQRNAIARAWQDVKPDDYVFLSDVDEIMAPDFIKRLEANELTLHFQGHRTLSSHRLRRQRRMQEWQFRLRHPATLFSPMLAREFLEYSHIALEQKFYYYFVNCQSKAMWYGSILTLGKNLIEPQALRDLRNRLPRAEGGGWHFSYMGGMEAILKKLGSIVEGDERVRTRENVEECLRTGRDLFGRTGADDYEFRFTGQEEIGLPGIGEFIAKYPDFYRAPESL